MPATEEIDQVQPFIVQVELDLIPVPVNDAD
jgi:predicted PilT family ATPase